MSDKTKHIATFEHYRFNPEEKLLENPEGEVKLDLQGCALLEELLRHSPKWVKKEDLLQRLWPDDRAEPRVLDQRLAQALKRLRQALGDNGKTPRYIETRRGVGFRFLPDVVAKEVLPEEALVVESTVIVEEPPLKELMTTQERPAAAMSEELPTGKASKRWLWRGIVLAVVLTLTTLTVIVWLRLWKEPARELKLRRLTSHSSESPIKAGAISPDGKCLAYVDNTGVHLRLIGQSDLYSLPFPKDLLFPSLAWFPNSDRLLIGGKQAADPHFSLWTVSIIQGAPPPAKVRDDLGEMGAAAVAPDGAQIAFVSGGGKEVWLMGSQGESARKVWAGEEGDKFTGLAWLKGGERLVLNRVHLAGSSYTVSLELLHLATKQRSTIIEDAGLRGGCASPNGRVIYSLTDSAENPSDTGVWEIKIDPASGARISAPRLITKLNSATVYNLSITADGRRLGFFKGAYQADVYVAEIEQNGGGLKNPRRLTLDDSNDLPTAWTADSQTVLFHSDRNGKFEIFKQGIAQPDAELLIHCREGCRGARMGADGASIFYFIRADWRQALSQPPRMMRMSIGGGRPEMMMEERALFDIRCARFPATRCVLSKRKLSALGTLVFYDFDPLHGQGQELARTDIDLPLGREHWSVSPDGREIGVALGKRQNQNGVVRVISLDGTTNDIVIKGWSGFHSLDWTADGGGWYIGSISAQSSHLLRVDRQGNAQVLRQAVGGFETWGVPSPDGKCLAVLEWKATDNMWELGEF